MKYARLKVRIVLSALVIWPALAQDPPDVGTILRKISATYKAASQYELISDVTRRGPEGEAVTGHALFAFKAPNRYRLEGAIPGMSTGDSRFDSMILVHDGSRLWFYQPKSKQFGSFPAATLTEDDGGDLGDLRPEAVDYFLMNRYREASTFQNSKFLRTETVEFNGAKVACYVLSVQERKRGGFEFTLWVDPKTSQILREDERDDDATLSAVFTTIKLSGPLSEDLFRFTPPPGARKMDVQP